VPLFTLSRIPPGSNREVFENGAHSGAVLQNKSECVLPHTPNRRNGGLINSYGRPFARVLTYASCETLV
jgi:hypothetical protein